MKHTTKYFLVGLVVFALLIVMGSIVTAKTDRVFYACVATSSGQMRMIPPNQACKRTEVKIWWNQVGPVGMPGELGPAGPQGPAGSSGIGKYSFICGNCYLEGIDLSGVDLNNAWLNLANLDEANLQQSNLSEAMLEIAGLSQANLSDAKLINAKMRNANLSYANLSSADLSGADLRDAWVGDVNLDHANFTNANLEGARVPQPPYICSSYSSAVDTIWSNTICPDGTNSDNNGNTCIGHFYENIDPPPPSPYPPPYPNPCE